MNLYRVICLVLFLCLYGCSGRSTDQLTRLNVIEKKIATVRSGHEKNQGNRSTYTMSDLIKFAQIYSTPAVNQTIQTILLESDADSLSNSLYPKVDLYASYGRSVFRRRDEEDSNFRLSPAMTWNIIRLLEYKKVNDISMATDDIVRMNTDLTNAQVMLEVVRLYSDFVIGSLKINQQKSLLSSSEKKLRIAQLNTLKTTKNTIAFTNAQKTVQEVKSKIRTLRAEFSLAEIKLKSFCNLPDNTTILLPDYKSIHFSPTSMGEFILQSISHSKDVAVSAILDEIESQKSEMVKKRRWLNFNFTASLGDLLSNPASAIYSSLSWTYNLLNQGNFNRKVALI